MNHTIFKSLTNEYEIVTLLHHRSKNQHRQANWFQHLNITYRHLRRILKLQIDINRLQINPKNNTKMTYKLKKIIQISQGLIKRSKSAYFAYNSILCLGQFITLGFALIGSLAKIYNLLLEIPGVAKSKPKIESSMKEVTQVEDDIGVEIVSEVVTEPEASKDIKPELDDIFKSEKPKKKKSRSSTPSTIEDIFKSNKPKLKKKKKKKSAIDDIFG